MRNEKDVEFVDSVMDGERYRAGRFAFSLRQRLFREHLGLLGQGKSNTDIRDPVADAFYKGTWMRAASVNTKIYDEVFCCLPADSVTSFDGLSKMKAKLPMAVTESAAAAKKLLNIQVWYQHQPNEHRTRLTY